MYRKQKPTETTLNVNTSYEGETIEQKINRIVNNKEPITDGAPLIYTERKDGVAAGHNIRTDRFEIALEAMDKVDRASKARREEYHKKLQEVNDKKNNGGAEPLQATGKQ